MAQEEHTSKVNELLSYIFWLLIFELPVSKAQNAWGKTHVHGNFNLQKLVF